MEENFTKYIYEFFSKLIKLYGFAIKRELNEENSYLIEYRSADFVIKIEKYFREFYATLYKTNKPDDEINLFNLLEYLKQDNETPKSDYFRQEKDIEECYRKQLNHISSVIYENYALLNNFFSSDDYELKFADFEMYWRNKHPELYKKM